MPAVIKENVGLPWLDKAGDPELGFDRYRATFDPYVTFEQRYLRYRRNTEARGPMPYYGEFDRELYGKERPR